MIKLNKINNLIKEKKISKVKICEHLNIQRATLHNYLTGKRNMPVGVLEKLSNILDTNINELITNDIINEPEIDYEKNIKDERLFALKILNKQLSIKDEQIKNKDKQIDRLIDLLSKKENKK